MKIYFDESMINDFLNYAEERKAKILHLSVNNSHMTTEDTKALALYFANTKKYYCTEKAETFYNGDCVSFKPVKMWLNDGRILETAKDIEKYLENCLENCLETDKNEFIQDYLYHIIFCDIERILRTNRNGNIDESDKRILNRARKQFENQIA